jgi:iron complex outermembrane receptor protein
METTYHVSERAVLSAAHDRGKVRADTVPCPLSRKSLAFAVALASCFPALAAEQPAAKKPAAAKPAAPAQEPAAPARPAAGAGGVATLETLTVTAKAHGGYNPKNPYDKNYAVPESFAATKTETPIMETPVSIQEVSRAVMDDQQVIGVKDALKNVSGVQSTPGFYDNFLIRGFTVNSGAYRDGLRQWLLTGIETANLTGIEVLKGPAAVLFGRIEPGGLINITTKRPLEEAYYSLQQQFGSYDLYRTTLDATGPLLDDRSLLYRLNFAYKTNNSFRDFVSQDHVFVAPSLTWRPVDRLEFNVDFQYQRDEFVEDGSDIGIPAIGDRPANIPISRYVGDGVANRNSPNTQNLVMVASNWNYRFDEDWKLTNRFQYTDVDYHQTIIYPTFLDSDNRTLYRSLWYTPLHRNTYSTNLDLTGHFQTGPLDHSVLLGFDYSLAEEKSGGGFSGDTPLVPPLDIYQPVYGVVDLSKITQLDNNFYWNYRDQWYGLYFQDQIKVYDKFHVMVGGRQDWAEYGGGYSVTSFQDAGLPLQRENFFSPRVGVLHQPLPWLSIYGNYVQSFGANNGRSSTGKPFAPEKAYQYEVGLKTEFFDKRLMSNLAFYQLTKQNLLTTDPTNPIYSIAVGEARSRGVELDVTGRLTENWSVIGSYAYTDAVITHNNDGNEGNQLPNVPYNSGSLWTKYEWDTDIFKGFSLGTGVYIRGQRQGDTANTFQLPGYVRWDASAGYSFKFQKSKITTQLNVYNLLDHTYYDNSSTRVNVRPGEPVTFLGSLRVEY